MPRRKKIGRGAKIKDKVKEREKEREEELKDEERIEDNEAEPEDNEVHESKQSSSSESKEEAAPKKKRPTVERKALAYPVKVSYSLDKLFEYQWPPDIHGEFYYLEHHISEFVVDASFSSKHKDVERHTLGSEEKHFLKEKSVITENQCASELFAIKSEDVCQLTLDHYPAKYKEFIRLSHERERRRLIRKAEEETQARTKRKVPNYMKRALKDISEFNSQLAMQRREERSSYFDMQTQIILVPANKTSRLHRDVTVPSQYPVALLPGQFQEFYRTYTPDELKQLPLSTVLKKFPPPSQPAPKVEVPQDIPEPTHVSPMESEESEAHDESSEEDAELLVSSKSPGSYKPPVRPDALCGICLRGAESNKKGAPEELIHCSQCENSGHPSCLDMSSQLVEVINTYPWQCMECKTCLVCRDPFDEDKMLFCDECDRGYHSFCVGLKQVPVGRWTCDKCGMCASCLKKTPGEGPAARWKHEFTKPRDGSEAQFIQTLCTACSRLFRAGNFCPMCLKVYRNDESDLPMVCCDECDRWIHTDCDGIDEKKYMELSKEKTKYKCVLCRGEKEERLDTFHKKNRT